MELLDDVVGPMRWVNDYKEIKGNLYCGIAILDEDRNEWVWKWDCGIESRADGDGNEKKGEASDAFKRAGFRWGIGRELYTSPFTFAKVPTVPSERGHGYELKNRFMRFYVAEIGYEGRTINRLVIVDNDGKTVFTYGVKRQVATAPKTAQEVGQQKLMEIEAKMAENAAKSANENAGATCERCQKPITGWVDSKGKTYTASAIIKRAQERYGGCYCATCMTELAGKRKVG